jgi:hypothetical protein
MDTKVKPVSRQVLAQAIAKIEEPEPQTKLYSSGDVARIVGWSQSYVIRLDKTDPDFPKGKRMGKPRGAKGKDHKRKQPRFWDEEGLRSILAFKREQDRRLGRL